MGAKISCYICEHYRSTGDQNIGLCTILDDSVYSVSSSSKECLYNFNIFPRILTKAQAKSRDKEAETKRTAFWEHAKKIKDEVDSWPEEKRRRNYGQ